MFTINDRNRVLSVKAYNLHNHNEEIKHLHIDATWINKQMTVGAMTRL